MSCPMCDGEVLVNGDGDLVCQGDCGETLTREDIDAAFEDDGDDFEDDGQPDEYTEWQDYMGGDDWDHGQYDEY